MFIAIKWVQVYAAADSTLQYRLHNKYGNERCQITRMDGQTAGVMIFLFIFPWPTTGVDVYKSYSMTLPSVCFLEIVRQFCWIYVAGDEFNFYLLYDVRVEHKNILLKVKLLNYWHRYQLLLLSGFTARMSLVSVPVGFRKNFLSEAYVV